MAASGPSLTEPVAKFCRFKRLTDGWKIIAVNDAYKLFPWADALYAADNHWWEGHGDCDGFENEKWSTHDAGIHTANDKLSTGIADRYGIRCVQGAHGDVFSTDPGVIYYGSNSGFQAVSLAILKGCKRIVLVGFDMRWIDGKSHFFGHHPEKYHQAEEDAYTRFARKFANALSTLPGDVSIVNATPGSALTCFPLATLEDALSSQLAA